MRQALVNARVFHAGALHHDLAVVIEGERIVAVAGEVPPDGVEEVDCGGRMLLPGFIDTQVNGGGGILFNDAPTVDTVAHIVAAHRPFGTTGLLPTLISDDLSVVRAAIRAVDEAIEGGVPGVLGVHIEGPFLNPQRHGIHDRARLRSLDREALAVLTSAKRGRTLVTLAPECVSPDAIAELVAAGVIVAAGHTEASFEEMEGAADAGLSGVTHLFNAMPPLASRAPGVVGATLSDARITAGLIVDGHHVHRAALALAVRVKGPDRLMLVTDAMSVTGPEMDGFWLQGRQILRDGTRLVDAAGTLAGSTLTMDRAVRNLIEEVGVDLATAVTMASATPARFLRLQEERGAIKPGLAADLILVDDEWRVTRSWIGGRSTSG